MNTLLGSSVFERMHRVVSRLDPAWIAFLGSLVLSAIAIHGTEGPNRDGMLYVVTAELFAGEGFAAARANFDWVFFPICIAFVSKISGLGYEAAGYALNVVLLACLCSTLVRITALQYGNAAWSACLVALSLPAFNHYRDFLIREFGFWLFSLLAILAALRWVERPNWRGGFAVQAFIAIACLFRVEAVAFFAALALWQFAATQGWRQRLLHLSMLLFLPVCGGLVLAGFIATGSIDIGSRITYYVMALTPAMVLSKFRLAASQFSTSVLSSYAEGEAGSILFFGLFSMIPKKFLLMSGAFIVPLVSFFWMDSPRRKIADWQPLGWFFSVYILVLTAFVTFNLFLSGRYVSFLNILVVPLIAVGLKNLLDRFPRWRYVFIGIALLIALANVVSLSPKRTLYREAGQWLAENADLSSKMYIGSPRAGYYAGAAYRVIWNRELPPGKIEEAVRNRLFEYYVLEMKLRDVKQADWIRSLNLVEVERFTSRTGDAVVILRLKNES